MTGYELKKLIKKAQQKDKEALQQLIEMFEPLILSKAEDEDTRQFLYLTLIEAIQRFSFDNPCDLNEYIKQTANFKKKQKNKKI